MIKTLPMIILAGGMATRLQPLSLTQPKSLVKVAGEPFIFHQLRLLKKQHFREVILCLGHMGELIKEAVNDGSEFGLQIYYSHDGNHLLGTAGAINNALHLVSEPAFFVMYGDSYLRCNFEAISTFYQQQLKPALMTIYHNKNLYDASNIFYQAPQIIQYDKKQKTAAMQHIEYGVSIFSKEIFIEYYSENLPCLAGVHRQLLANNKIAAYEITQRFYEVGSFGGIADLNTFLTSSEI